MHIADLKTKKLIMAISHFHKLYIYITEVDFWSRIFHQKYSIVNKFRQKEYTFSHYKTFIPYSK